MQTAATPCCNSKVPAFRVTGARSDDMYFSQYLHRADAYRSSTPSLEGGQGEASWGATHSIPCKDLDILTTITDSLKC